MATKFMTLDIIKSEVKKETVFTQYLDVKKKISIADDSPSEFDNVLFIGNDPVYGDVFKAWDNDGSNEFTIYFGIKGDEFD